MSTMKGTQRTVFESDNREMVIVDDNGIHSPVGLDVREVMYKLRENFRQKPALNAVIDTTGASSSAALIAYTIANKDFEVLGSNMTTALCTFSAAGGITLTSAGGANDQAIVTPHLDTDQTAWAVAGVWGSENAPTFETQITSGASIATTIIWAGYKLTNTDVVGTDDDQVFFRYEAGVTSGNWVLVHSRAGVDTSTDTGIAVAVSTAYNLKIVVDRSYSATPLGIASTPALTFKAYINGALVGTDSYAALVTAKNFIPYVGVRGVSKAIDVKWLECGRLATAA